MKRIALFVGINQYDDPGITSLNCAVNDAQKLAGLFEHRLGFKCEVLTDADLRRGLRVTSTLRKLGSQLKEGDTFLLFFAGHGKTVGENDTADQLFLLQDADRVALDAGAVAGEGLLSLRNLRVTTERWHGVTRLFIFDACRTPIEKERVSKRDGEQLAQFRGEIVFRDIGLSSNAMPSIKPAPAVLINSCQNGQQAEELAAYPGGRGLFSAALGEVIEGRLASSQALRVDASLISDVGAHMRKLVRDYEQRESEQQPYIFLKGEGIDLLAPRVDEVLPPTGAGLDERLWQIALNKVKRTVDPAEKIALLEAHMEDERIDYCCHVDLAQTLIQEYEALPVTANAESLAQAQEAAWQTIQAAVSASDSPATKILLLQTYAAHNSAHAGRADALIAALQAEQTRQEAEKTQREAAKTQAREQAALARQAEEARRNDPRNFKPSRAGEEVPKLCPESPEMVAISPGKFLMGSPDNESGRRVNESPQHEVQIGYWLAVGKYAVTFDEWDRFATETKADKPDDQGWGRGTRPVINVSWDDSQSYLEWLNAKAGFSSDDPQRYRLLSEAEWEYACRAGTTGPFWWGDSINTGQANYDGRGEYNGSPKGEYRQKTLVVDSFDPNPWGLYNVHGNVWEWVQDWYHDNYRNAPGDGRAWEQGGTKERRVLRGGSWVDNPEVLRSANRGSNAPSGRLNSILVSGSPGRSPSAAAGSLPFGFFTLLPFEKECRGLS
jgi:formylglycine-generating enzyme required for sulfatase activity